MVAENGFMMEIGLIGGSGFIGTVLAHHLLERGSKVRILDIAEPPPDSAAEYKYSDVTDFSLLTDSLQGCKLIINLAAAHRDNVRPLSLYHDVNVLGAENVCRAAGAIGIEKILFTSSVAVYGMQKGELGEEALPRPCNPYGKTKWEAECIYREWQRGDPRKRRLDIVRPTVVFGEGNRGNVYNLLAQLSRPHFVMVGKGNNRKSMAYVSNVAAFLAHLATAVHEPGADVYNYCDTPVYDMNGLIRAVRMALNRPIEPSFRLPYVAGIMIGSLFDLTARIAGRTFPVSKVRVEKFCANSVFLSERAHSGDFKPPYDLSEALRRTILYEFRPDKKAQQGVAGGLR
jgi:GlcNAc-P-P-Und epimerase